MQEPVSLAVLREGTREGTQQRQELTDSSLREVASKYTTVVERSRSQSPSLTTPF